MVARDPIAARERAEANSRRREESRAAAQVAMADVAARKEAELAKTARLRALRLAKEAEDKAAELPAARSPGKRK
jgi:hypothetical protein